MVCLLPTLIRLSASVDIAYTRIIDLNNALYACMVASDLCTTFSYSKEALNFVGHSLQLLKSVKY